MRIDEELDIVITLNVSECTEGIYLKWINKLGEYCYYLFDISSESNEIKNGDVNIVNFLKTVDFENGYHKGTNYSQSKNGQKTIKLFAPLVDRDTFLFLESLIESVYIDMFCGYGDNNEELWMGVNVSEGTLTKTNTPLKDFECNLILPFTFIQSL